MYKVYFNIKNITQVLEKGEFTLFPKPYKIYNFIRFWEGLNLRYYVANAQDFNRKIS